MNTAEMWLKAQNDGKFYEMIDGDVAYSKKYGLTDKGDFNYVWELSAWDDNGASALDELLYCEWKEMDTAMTIEEAEERFGIKIIS